MRRMSWLAGLVFAGISANALALAPSYDYIQLDYVARTPSGDSSGLDYQGVDFQLSALIAPYLLFGATYEFLESDEFGFDDRLQNQTVTAGLAGRIPIVRNMLEGTIGADFVYADSTHRQDFADDEYDNGYQVKATLRANFKYFEAIPSVRYIDIFDQDELAAGIQLLGCAGYGICGTAGYEYFKEAEDHRWFAGVRFYYN
jgi:hypothetical protein